jgi:hypothetical protein
MPTVHRIGSIKIDVYSRDHLPPHFHAIYGNYEALIVIRTLGIYAGGLPSPQLKAVKKWANNVDIKNMLLENFYRLNPKLRK